jgi:hypothetical protein
MHATVIGPKYLRQRLAAVGSVLARTYSEDGGTHESLSAFMALMGLKRF